MKEHSFVSSPLGKWRTRCSISHSHIFPLLLSPCSLTHLYQLQKQKDNHSLSLWAILSHAPVWQYSPKQGSPKMCTFRSLSPNLSHNYKNKMVLKTEIDSLRLVIVKLQTNRPVTHQCLEDCSLWWHTGFPSAWSPRDLSATSVFRVEQQHHTYVPLMPFTDPLLSVDTHSVTYLPVCTEHYAPLSEFLLILKSKTDGNQ